LKRIYYCICISLLLSIAISHPILAQTGRITISGSVTDSASQPIPSVTIMLLKAADSSTVKITSSNNKGSYIFEDIAASQYLLSFSATGFTIQYISLPALTASHTVQPVRLQQRATILEDVTVVSRRPLIELRPDKTVVNVDASVTNVGATALEVLEKSPGVTVDRNGSISLKGKSNVLILMDGKPSYLPAADLATYLGSLSASQLDQIEIMTNPSAKYDASGSTGIINIKTKKNKAKGFNGTLSLGYGQGVYYKNNNSLSLNYRNGKFNFYGTYSNNTSQYYTDLYALRWYYDKDPKNVTSTFEQPTYFTGPLRSHNLKAGVDYFLNKKTTLGLSIAGTRSTRGTIGTSDGKWMDNAGQVDSIVHTASDNKSKWRNLGVTASLRHQFTDTKELTVDVDYLGYNIRNNQLYENTLTGNGSYKDGVRGNLPSTLHVFSAKADYSQQLNKTLKLEGGWKTSYVETDNLAEYELLDNTGWHADLNRSNHFLYKENINGVYVNTEQQLSRWTLQGGLRFENTSYKAHQLGNAIKKDSSFSRQYSSLFPTAFVSYQADSANTFTVSAGRRIDRPAFQKLNPFVYVINKYTFQTGNPYFRPQYTWNMELSHQYKQLLVTTLSYGITNDYFSQIFLSDTNGLIIYTEGNIGRMTNVGLSVSSQFSPTPWWSVSLQVNGNHKKIKGVVVNSITSTISQMNMNISNQFRFNKGWAAELSGFYISRNQNDLQEVLDPTGQVGVGVSKQIIKNKATLKLGARDIFYTQVMAGLTSFQHATEYFTLKRDSRVVTLAFSWRFGKPLKGTTRKASASDDIKERVGQN
jgi:iron complex outermembrane receptor protein